MGWLFVLGFAGLAFLGLYASKRCSPIALRIAASALLLGIAGYAWQGSPDAPGNPVSPAAQR